MRTCFDLELLVQAKSASLAQPVVPTDVESHLQYPPQVYNDKADAFNYRADAATHPMTNLACPSSGVSLSQKENMILLTST